MIGWYLSKKKKWFFEIQKSYEHTRSYTQIMSNGDVETAHVEFAMNSEHARLFDTCPVCGFVSNSIWNKCRFDEIKYFNDILNARGFVLKIHKKEMYGIRIETTGT